MEQLKTLKWLIDFCFSIDNGLRRRSLSWQYSRLLEYRKQNVDLFQKHSRHKLGGAAWPGLTNVENLSLGNIDSQSLYISRHSLEWLWVHTFGRLLRWLWDWSRRLLLMWSVLIPYFDHHFLLDLFLFAGSFGSDLVVYMLNSLHPSLYLSLFWLFFKKFHFNWLATLTFADLAWLVIIDTLCLNFWNQYNVDHMLVLSRQRIILLTKVINDNPIFIRFVFFR